MRIYLTLLILGILCTSSSCGARKNLEQIQSTNDQVAVVTPTPFPETTEPPAVEEVSPESSEVEEAEETIETVTETVQEQVEEVVTTTVSEVDEADELFDHSSYDNLLKQYVSAEGNVNYAGFKSNWSILRGYIKELAEVTPDDSWSQENQLAYWMNAYNALTIDLILRHYPLASIKDINKPWDQRFWQLGGKWINLNEIEHKILRTKGDPRIHFGINCASFSCPPLLNEAFTAKNVDAQLDLLARNFINDPQRNVISANSIEISKIFNWFGKDFKTEGTVIDYLNKYSDITISSSARKKYKDYDWTLNK